MAVASCMKAARPGEVDESRLIVDGWREQSEDWTNGHVFSHQKNAAIVFRMDAPLSDVCWVRVRLADAASIEAAGEEIDDLLGTRGERRPGELGKIFWRKGSQIVAFGRFDDGPGSPPYVIQIGIGAMPKEFR